MLATSESGRQLDELLGLSIAAIDIPDDIRARAIARYEHIAQWLAGWWRWRASGEIYSQGSFRLGTVVTPITPDGHYDMDLVCCRDIARSSTSQRELKEEVGDALAAYVATNPDGNPILKEGKRCWTLQYPGEPYHMDVLPALPDDDDDALPNAIVITDTEFTQWLPSNPKDYASWFHSTAEFERRLLREAVAAAKRMDVEDVPDHELKTTLQRAVQALKRHRDMHFAREPELVPASIIITTLAGRAYRGGGSLYDVLVDVTRRMADYVEDRQGVYWVPNPVQHDENFADRWRDRPSRAQRFFDWLDGAHTDFTSIGAERGVDTILEAIGRSFGDEPRRRAGERFGVRLTDQRDAGRLRMSSNGLLGAAAGGVTVRPHTFHGDAPPPRRS